MYGVELGIIILATLSCALVSSSPSMGSTGLLIFWRVMMVCKPLGPECATAKLTPSRASVLAAITRYLQ